MIVELTTRPCGGRSPLYVSAAVAKCANGRWQVRAAFHSPAATQQQIVAALYPVCAFATRDTAQRFAALIWGRKLSKGVCRVISNAYRSVYGVYLTNAETRTPAQGGGSKANNNR